MQKKWNSISATRKYEAAKIRLCPFWFLSGHLYLQASGPTYEGPHTPVVLSGLIFDVALHVHVLPQNGGRSSDMKPRKYWPVSEYLTELWIDNDNGSTFLWEPHTSDWSQASLAWLMGRMTKNMGWRTTDFFPGFRPPPLVSPSLWTLRQQIRGVSRWDTRYDPNISTMSWANSVDHMGRLKMREWKMRYGQNCKGGKCRIGKCGSR